MRKPLSLLLLALAAASARADVVLTLDPTDTLRGAPGETIGWAFTLTSDATSWISVVTTTVADESNPGIGVYSDLAGFLGGPDMGVLAPGDAAWIVPFDTTPDSGIGAFSIRPDAAIGSMDLGVIDLEYEKFSADPNICSTCATGFANLQTSFEVEVVAPEPAVGRLLAPLCALLWWRRRASDRRI
jgi:hypothetical protein